MKIQKQISVLLNNQPGVLARICGVLQSKKINIQAISVVDTADNCIVRFLTDNAAKAVSALKDAGFSPLTNSVVTLRIANRVGGLAGVARKLSAKRVNINYAYCTASSEQDSGLLVLGSCDLQGVRKALK